MCGVFLFTWWQGAGMWLQGLASCIVTGEKVPKWCPHFWHQLEVQRVPQTSFDNLLAGFMELRTAVKLTAAVYYRGSTQIRSVQGRNAWAEWKHFRIGASIVLSPWSNGQRDFPSVMYHQSTEYCLPGMLTWASMFFTGARSHNTHGAALLELEPITWADH